MHIQRHRPHRCHLLQLTRQDERRRGQTTPTDPRSRRNRTSRRGAHRKARAQTAPIVQEPACPTCVLPESPYPSHQTLTRSAPKQQPSKAIFIPRKAACGRRHARGHLVGQLPWGYVRDPESKIAVPDPERAPLVREMFERYATGEESDRTIAAWLNAKGARSAKDRPFGKDTVRDMLVNAAYAGYVSGLRDKRKQIKGLHEAIVTEELFDRVQEVRAWRKRVLKPGRKPSEEYLLRKMLLCERCGSRMHGGRGSTGYVRRYQCSSRRYHSNCDQPIAKAEPLEQQLVQWLSCFKPDGELRNLILSRIETAARQAPGDGAARRKDLNAQLDRLQELYVVGDVSKERYTWRRQAIEEELQRIEPPVRPDLARAEQVLGDFASFWQAESDPFERRKLIASPFDNVWQDEGRIVAVKPRPAFAAYFKAVSETRNGRGRETRASKTATEPEVPATGATGVIPGLCAPP
ncbi:MAG: recombinase family protein [Solirubrobacteraceae bacterium]